MSLLFVSQKSEMDVAESRVERLYQHVLHDLGRNLEYTSAIGWDQEAAEFREGTGGSLVM